MPAGARFELARPCAPAGLVMADRQHRRGDGRCSRTRPESRGVTAGATVGIIGMAALAEDSFGPIDWAGSDGRSNVSTRMDRATGGAGVVCPLVRQLAGGRDL